MSVSKQGISPQVEYKSYAPSYKDTTDLEAATKTITATSEAVGVLNADYNAALTCTIPTDSRIAIMRMVSRLAVTIDSFDTATHLYCRVYVDAQDANHRLFDMDWDSTGAKLTAVDVHADAYAVIFALLKDGAAHTFYFFFWVNQAVNAVISLVELWEAVGSCDTAGTSSNCINVTHSGFLGVIAKGGQIGSGTYAMKFSPDGYWRDDTSTLVYKTHLVGSYFDLYVYGSVATDLNYLTGIYLWFRSE